MSSARQLLDTLQTQDQRQAYEDVHGEGSFRELAQQSKAEEADEPDEWTKIRESTKARGRGEHQDDSIERRRAALVPNADG